MFKFLHQKYNSGLPWISTNNKNIHTIGTRYVQRSTPSIPIYKLTASNNSLWSLVGFLQGPITSTNILWYPGRRLEDQETCYQILRNLHVLLEKNGEFLVGGWTNPFEECIKYYSNWIMSPGVNIKKWLKPPRFSGVFVNIFFPTNMIETLGISINDTEDTHLSLPNKHQFFKQLFNHRDHDELPTQTFFFWIVWDNPLETTKNKITIHFGLILAWSLIIFSPFDPCKIGKHFKIPGIRGNQHFSCGKSCKADGTLTSPNLRCQGF